MHFRATDLDIEIVDKAPAKVDRAGATTVSAVTLNEIVRKLPDVALVTLTEAGHADRRFVATLTEAAWLRRSRCKKRRPGSASSAPECRRVGPASLAPPSSSAVSARGWSCLTLEPFP